MHNASSSQDSPPEESRKPIIICLTVKGVSHYHIVDFSAVSFIVDKYKYKYKSQ